MISRPSNSRLYLAFFSTLGLMAAMLGKTQAQVSSYSFSQIMGTYTELTPVDNSNLDTVLNTGILDERNFARPLGFTFRYNNRTYTSVTVSTNGFLALGTSTTGAYSFSGMVDFQNNRTFAFDYNDPNVRRVTGLEAIIGGFLSDMQRAQPAGVGSLYLATVGTAPNRKFVAQYKNWRRYFPTGTGPNSAASDDYNFQIVLYEGSNLIEFVYGTFAMSISGNRPQVGLRGQDASLRDILLVSGSNWNSLSRSSNPADQVLTDPNSLPPSGLTLRFAPIPPAPNDIGITEFIAPRTDQTSCLLSAQEPVRVVVRNYGTNAQTQSSIAYRLNNGTVKRQTFSFTPNPLQPDQADTVTFSGPNAADLSARGTYSFKAYSELPNEPQLNRNNDTAGYSITLTGPIDPPLGPIGTLAEAVSGQWKEAKGANTPSGSASNWSTGFPFQSESMALVFDRTGTNASNNEWLLSPNYNLTPNFYLVFNSYVTKDAFGGNPITNIGDDSIKVMVSTDCGNTWRSLKKFSQADVAAGLIDNNPDREFRVGPLVAAPGAVRVAFFGTSNNTPAVEVWRYHIDNIKFEEVIPTDLGVVRILSPVSAQQGCLLGNQECVMVVVKNFGSATQTQSPVSYRVGRSGVYGTPRTSSFTFNPPLPPGGLDTVSFCGTLGVDLSTAGKLYIQAYTNLPGETSTSHRNDTAKSDTVRLSAPLAPTASIVTDFGVGNTNGWGRGRGLDYPTGNTSNWGFSFVGTGSYIGISFPITANTSLREWWYSPSYQGSAFTTITFKAALVAGGSSAPAPNGFEDDTVYLKVSNDCGATWRTVRKFSQADVASGTLTQNLNAFSFLVPSAGQKVSFGFFANNMSTSSQLAYRFLLDDVKIRDAVQNDQGVIAVLSPFTNLAQCTQVCVPISVAIRNYGAAPQATSTVAYSVNGGAPVEQTFTLSPPLPPGATDTIAFSLANCVNLGTPGTYRFVFYTITTGEDNETHRNDTLGSYNVTTRAAITVPGTGADVQDFENATAALPPGWLAENNQLRDWKVQLGRGNDDASGFETDGFGTQLYFANLYSWFATPRYIIPATGGSAVQFDFRVVDGARNEAVELTHRDSIILEASTTCGATWQRLLRIDSISHNPAGAFITHTVPLAGLAGQEVVFRVQAWVYRNTPTGVWVDMDNWRVGTPVANKSLAVVGQYRLMPNPARETVLLKGPEGKARYSVVSAMGQTVLRGQLIGQTHLDLRSLTPGLYRVHVQQDGGDKPSVLTLLKE